MSNLLSCTAYVAVLVPFFATCHSLILATLLQPGVKSRVFLKGLGCGSTSRVFSHMLHIFAAQPLAPCALALEGTVLGASAITWVGGRTVASAAAAVGILQLGHAMGWGLRGVWAGAGRVSV